MNNRRNPHFRKLMETWTDEQLISYMKRMEETEGGLTTTDPEAWAELASRAVNKK